MRVTIVVIILFCMMGFSCEDDKKSPLIVIKTGMECGWCGGADSLVITKQTSFYEFVNPCDATKNKKTEESTSRSEWSDLLGSLNWDEFTKVNVNTCALCADGCDTWIFIQNGHITHQIRFTESSSEIDPIRIFVDKLEAIHEEFRF
jgi:hypothetical protein